ncbi:MAG: DUF4178 domain-containing protein [Desulfobacteraceae bacterium]|nr:DUF4178 domain-containing protein [Desulfobacteraceae bacterium]
MNTDRISCPSCGAGHSIHNPGIVTVVCEYCGSAIYWDDQKVELAGKQSIVPEGFTRLYRAAAGSLNTKRFIVMGRVRYSFGRGFWDEWFLEFQDGSIGWLTEDNYELALQTRTSLQKTASFETVRPGQKIVFQNKEFIVHEVGNAECIGMEGNLPIAAQTGEKYKFADATSPDGKYVLGIEYDAVPPSIFIGRWLSYGNLTLDDEGVQW